MSEKKRIRDLKAALDSLVNENLAVTVREKRGDFLDDITDILERLKTRSLATDNTSKLLETVENTLQNTRALIEQYKGSNIVDLYFTEVKKHTMELPEQVMVSQGENRFKGLESDPAKVKLIKVLKRTVRTFGTIVRDFSNIFRKLLNKPTRAYGPWDQEIPYRSLAEFHLLNTDEIFRKRIGQDYRKVTDIILALEEYMAENLFESEHSRREENEIPSDLLGARVGELLENVINLRRELPEQTQNDFSIIQKDLNYYLERAGTLERTASFYSKSKVEKKSSHFRSVLVNYLNRWEEANLQLLDKAETVKEFLSFRKALEDQGRDFIKSLEKFFESYLTEPIKSLRKDLEGIKAKIQEFGQQQNKDTAHRFINDSKDLLGKLVREVRSPLTDIIEETRLSNEANLFSEHVLLKANTISENVLFVHDLEADKNPPELDYRMLEWRLLVVRSLKERTLKKLQPSQQHYEDFLVTIRGDLEEVQEVIEVNFNSALELFEEENKENSPYSIIIEALERTLTKLENTTEAISAKHEQLKLAVLDGHKEFSDKMLHLIHEGDSKELQLLDAKYKVKQKAHGWQTKAGARWARIQDSLALTRRFLWKKIKEYFSSFRRFLGFEQKDTEEVIKTDVATYLSETDAKIKELPYIYRRLFNFDMETDRRFYVAINQNFGNLKKAFESWEEDYPATFAVVGEKGAGKSTYLSYAIDDFFKEREVKDINLAGGIYGEVDFIKFMEKELDLENVDSIEGIIEAIRNTKKKKVIVLEALQNFYLRNINGYGAIESLLYVISETKESIFWVVSCSLYAWNFLDKAVSVGEYFSHVVRTDKLDERQIESVIMNRHRSSGYELHFEPSAVQSKSRAYRKLMDQEESAREYLREAYFEDLTALSEGNASIAMIFWIRSIRDFDDTHFYIKPLEVTSMEIIQDLKPDVLFTLATIVLHDTLTAKELSEILQFTEQESKLMLVRLKTRGILRQEKDRYFINQLVYRQIVRVLKERNIIHLV
ncbi:MAG: hypothetical protein ACNS64_01080 [Candidatus Halalkalibacterium sp. M3_1C_030]